MEGQSCPLPSNPGDAESTSIRRMLAAHRVAIVGLSDDPSRPSFGIASYLISVGKQVIPVNPNHTSIQGLKCHASLEQVPGPIDLVNVFRRPEHCAQVVRSAIAVGGGLAAERDHQPRGTRAGGKGEDRLRAESLHHGGAHASRPSISTVQSMTGLGQDQTSRNMASRANRWAGWPARSAVPL